MRRKAPAIICLAAAVALAAAKPAAAACSTAEAGAMGGFVAGAVISSLACGPLFFVCAAITTTVSSTLGSGVGTMIDRGIRECDDVTTEIAVRGATSGRLDRPTRRAGRGSRGPAQETAAVLVPPLYKADAAGEESVDPTREYLSRTPWHLLNGSDLGVPYSELYGEPYDPNLFYWRLPLSPAQLARVLSRPGQPPARPVPSLGRSPQTLLPRGKSNDLPPVGLQRPLPRGKSNDFLPMGRSQFRNLLENPIRLLPRGKSNNLPPLKRAGDNPMRPPERRLPPHNPENLRDPRSWKDVPWGTDDSGTLQQEEEQRLRQM